MDSPGVVPSEAMVELARGRLVAARQLGPHVAASALKALAETYGRLLGILEDACGRGPAGEIVVEAGPGRGQVCVGAGRLPAESLEMAARKQQLGAD